MRNGATGVQSKRIQKMSVIEELKKFLEDQETFWADMKNYNVNPDFASGKEEAFIEALVKLEELEAGGERMNYFISYAWYKLDDTGFGNCDFNAKSKITQIEHLREIEKIIKDRNNKDRNNFAQVVILNWKELGVSK